MTEAPPPRGPITGYYPETEEEKAQVGPERFGPDANHMEHFQFALRNALRKWPDADTTWAQVTFWAQVEKRNPGWILYYAATVDPSG